MSELMPCPLCAGDARVGHHLRQEWVECSKCEGDAHGNCCIRTDDGGWLWGEPPAVSWNRRSVAALIGSLPALNADELERLADALVEARHLVYLNDVNGTNYTTAAAMWADGGGVSDEELRNIAGVGQ